MEWLNGLIIKSIESVDYINSPKGRTFASDGRPYGGLSFCLSGSITYVQNGVAYVSEPGNVIYLPKGGTYKLFTTAGGVFPLVNFQAVTPLPDTFEVQALRNPREYPPLFEKLKKAETYGTTVEAMAVLYEILARLGSENARDLPQRILDKIHTDYADTSLSNTSLASATGISEVYLRKLFAKYLGTTPKQYIRQVRVDKAKEMLGGSSRSVGEIAEACGFSSPYHFCKTFRQLTGETPGEYRKGTVQKL